MGSKRSYVWLMGRKSIKHIRQREIVEAFYEVTRLEGLENASISKVAAHLGIRPSLVMHYFHTREELIFALIEYNLEQYKIMFSTHADVPDRHQRIIGMIDNLFSKQWNLLFDDGVFYSCYALIFRSDKIKVLYKSMHDSLRQFLAAQLAEGVQEGILEMTNCRQTADQVFIIVEGAYYYLSLIDDKEEYAEKLNEYKQLCMRLIRFRGQPTFLD